jgi:hypothetical protein
MRKKADECRSFKIRSRQLCANYAAGTSGPSVVVVGSGHILWWLAGNSIPRLPLDGLAEDRAQFGGYVAATHARHAPTILRELADSHGPGRRSVFNQITPKWPLNRPQLCLQCRAESPRAENIIWSTPILYSTEMILIGCAL